MRITTRRFVWLLVGIPLLIAPAPPTPPFAVQNQQATPGKVVYLPLIVQPPQLAIAGGTYNSFMYGVIGTTCLFEPKLADGRAIGDVYLHGPPGWLSNQPLLMHPSEYLEGIRLSDRSPHWIFEKPVTRVFTATVELNSGQTIPFNFPIDASNTLPVPPLTASATATQVTVTWTATADMKSFYVGIETGNFFPEIVAEALVAGTERSITFSGLSSGPYAVTILAFSNDLKTPGAIHSPFNISENGTVFSVP